MYDDKRTQFYFAIIVEGLINSIKVVPLRFEMLVNFMVKKEANLEECG